MSVQTEKKTRKLRFDLHQDSPNTHDEWMIEIITWGDGPYDYRRGWIKEQGWSPNRWLAICIETEEMGPACQSFESITKARSWLKKEWKRHVAAIPPRVKRAKPRSARQ